MSFHGERMSFDSFSLTIAKVHEKKCYTNCCYASKHVLKNLMAKCSSIKEFSRSGSYWYYLVQVMDQIVLKVIEDSDVQKDHLALNDAHLLFLQKKCGERVTIEEFNISSQEKLESISFQIQNENLGEIEIDAEILSSEIKKKYKGQYFCEKQLLLVQFNKIDLQLLVLSGKSVCDAKYAKLSTDTEISILIGPGSAIKVLNEQSGNIRRNIDLSNLGDDLLALGLGGLENMVNFIMIKAFIVRFLPNDSLQRNKHKHVRGMILHGPPGTGKTLLARTMAKILNAKIKVINGPEVFSKWIGQSEERMRAVFDEASMDQEARGERSRLHIIVFDEIDSIGKKRTGDSNDPVADRVVNQMLTMIDGYSQLNNIFIIGTTNRIDLVDSALLRPGRLEIILRIDPPDVKGREQILQVHAQPYREMNLFSSSIDLRQIALATDGWSGADLAGMIGAAFSFATFRVSSGNWKNVKAGVILQEDLDKVIADSSPHMEEHVRDFLERCRYHGFIQCGGEHGLVAKKVISLVVKAKSSKDPVVNCLLEGIRGTGKTSIAATIALDCDFTYVSVISHKLMIGLSESSKCTQIFKVIEDVYKSPSSLIVLDDIESLMGHNADGAIARALLDLLTCLPPREKHLVVIATSTTSLSDASGILGAFTQRFNVPELNVEDIEMILKNVFGAWRFSSKDYAHAASVLSHVPIKKLYTSLDFARNDELKFDERSLHRCLQFFGKEFS